MKLIFTILGAFLLISRASFAIELAMPLKCEYQKDCFIQHYVDVDFGKKNQQQDYRCSSLTYDEHKGTDFRLKNFLEIKKDYQVLVAADGEVVGVRNDMNDFDYIKNPELVKKRECGNGVVIKHEDGFETQYCHLKKGSVVLEKGQKVKTGDLIGFVGVSGMSEFAHLHFSVRKDSKVIDPFSNSLKCDKNFDVKKESLWNEKVADLLKYEPITILNYGFSSSLAKSNTMKIEELLQKPFDYEQNKIIFWFNIIGIKKGDILSVDLKNKDGARITKNTKTFNKNKAQFFQYVGKQRIKISESDEFVARVEVKRSSKVLFEREFKN